MQSAWLVSEPERLRIVAERFLNRSPLLIEAVEVPAVIMMEDDGSPDGDGKRQGKQAAKVAVVPLHGVMTKYDTCESYGTRYIADRLAELAADPSVVGIVLDIDSGGGSSNSVPPLLEGIKAVRASGKPIFAHADACCSAAYWVASRCDAIYMDNPLSEAGSIGAYSVVIDDTAPDPQTGERRISVYAPESTDKNSSYREAVAGNVKPLQEELSELVAAFRASVMEGRPRINAEAEGVMTGRTFTAAKAISLGMADAVRTLSETVEAVFAVASLN